MALEFEGAIFDWTIEKNQAGNPVVKDTNGAEVYIPAAMIAPKTLEHQPSTRSGRLLQAVYNGSYSVEENTTVENLLELSPA